MPNKKGKSYIASDLTLVLLTYIIWGGDAQEIRSRFASQNWFPPASHSHTSSDNNVTAHSSHFSARQFSVKHPRCGRAQNSRNLLQAFLGFVNTARLSSPMHLQFNCNVWMNTNKQKLHHQTFLAMASALWDMWQQFYSDLLFCLQ